MPRRPEKRRTALSEPAPAARTLDYASYVTGLMAWLTNRLSTSASASYRGRFGIGVMEWRVMAHLAIEPGCTAARIGRVIGLDKAAISRTVTILLQRGLAVRNDEPPRGQLLTLTADGQALHAQVLQVALERETLLLAPLSQTERTTLRALLCRMLEHLPSETR